MHGFKQNKDCNKIKYTCHRSGDLRVRGKQIRTLKIQGSNKMNAFCPAGMAVGIRNEKYVVTFCKAHVGHRQDDLGHLFLSLSEKQHIATKIASKIPFETILDDIRDSISNCQLERLHLLAKKDFYNIEQSFNLNSTSVRHKKDAISVDIWVELESSRSILFYKPQDTIYDTDFG
nr:unnamed protein product [Callosobruchus analis]